MNFKEAFEQLKLGKKLCRAHVDWPKNGFIVYTPYHLNDDGDKVQASLQGYRLLCKFYDMPLHDLLADDWLTPDTETLNVGLSFGDIIEELKLGKKAKRSTWSKAFIILDNMRKDILIYDYESMPYSPIGQDLLANDWTVLDD